MEDIEPDRFDSKSIRFFPGGGKPPVDLVDEDFGIDHKDRRRFDEEERDYKRFAEERRIELGDCGGFSGVD